mmetsp:Transcript_87728/g.281678  ORF Transcript_87728/g.281678 Transcript_87728/m.281678 type:complete len:132 (-) Transcript_87728:130-525(-)
MTSPASAFCVCAMLARKHIDVAYDDAPLNGPGAAAPAEEQRASGDGADAGRTAAVEEVRSLQEVGVLPEAGDNCAILRRRLDVGARVRLSDDLIISLAYTLMEGHRIAIAPVEVDTHGGRNVCENIPVSLQ